MIEMKKKDIVDLVRYHVDGNESGFRDLAYELAMEFNKTGDVALSRYMMLLLSGQSSSFMPQSTSFSSDFFKKLEPSSSMLLIPDVIRNDINGIKNAIGYKAGINKFLFAGAPGTGKTEMARHLARVLNKNIYSVNFEYVIDSKLGQTGKNIATLFDDINRQSFPENLIILFDEIDSLALDRMNSKDLREMGRATSALMKGLDELNPDIVLIATTNMMDFFDRALIRRFDKVIDFSRYTQEDLAEVAYGILEHELKNFNFSKKNIKICQHIFSLSKRLPYPGELRNIIRTSIAFSNPDDDVDYVRNLMNEIFPDMISDCRKMRDMGFSLREMEILTGISRSTLSRQLNVGAANE